MRVTYELTFDDYRDGLQLAARSRSALPISAWERYQLLLLIPLSIVLFVVIMVVETVWRVRHGLPPATADERTASSLAFTVLLATLPYLLIYGFAWPILCRSVLPRERRAMKGVLLANWVATAVVLGVTHWVAPADETADNPFDLGEALLHLAPWLILFLTLWFVFLRFIRGAQRRNWDGSQHLHGPQVLELNDEGLEIASDKWQSHYRWAGLRALRENERIFAVFISDVGFYIVPKRVISEPNGVERFRATIESHIGRAVGTQLGFTPILPPPVSTYGHGSSPTSAETTKGVL